MFLELFFVCWDETTSTLNNYCGIKCTFKSNLLFSISNIDRGESLRILYAPLFYRGRSLGRNRNCNFSFNISLREKVENLSLIHDMYDK